MQPMDDASPPKWHLAHTSWFFETFLLKPLLPGYRVFHPLYETLFNSYYNGVGDPFPRRRRGHLSRPTVSEVMAYRAHVDEAMVGMLQGASAQVEERTTLGLHHEQQHQELLLTDVNFNFGHNPLAPVYQPVAATPASSEVVPLKFDDHPGGLVDIGATAGFCFDNERPRHRVFLQPFAIAQRLVTCEEYLAFIEDGGYQQPALWLSDGWTWLQQSGIGAPLYWRQCDGIWQEYRLSGVNFVEAAAPVTHVSYYEADAYTRWAGCRLASEAEWETAAAQDALGAGNFVTGGRLHPAPALAGNRQFFGDTWEWTSSPYVPYPGFRPLEGSLGEYNGKFMSNQLVLRGGSCATPPDHIRASYRNFFYPPDRWQFTGIRLALDAD